MNYRRIFVLDNIRSAYNVGSILRVAAAFGFERVICCGITPYPKLVEDTRLPHVARKATEMIAKTALGAQDQTSVEHYESVIELLTILKETGTSIVALEQNPQAKPLRQLVLTADTAIICGNEPNGVQKSVLAMADIICEIEQAGPKESLNVATAAAIAAYQVSIKA